MKNLLVITFIIVLLSGCRSKSSTDGTALSEGVHRVTIEEVLQTSQYTYLHVSEGENKSWLALPKMQALAGETYYYKEGLPMTDFESKELNRTFDQVLFIDRISKNPVLDEGGNNSIMDQHSGVVIDNNRANAKGPDNKQIHEVIADEILQTSKYTYLHVKDGEAKQWLAVSKMEASIGSTYYYTGGLLMTNFVSKELNRTFQEVLFVDNIFSSAPESEANNTEISQNAEVSSKGSAIDLVKEDVGVKHSKGDITIENLLKNKKSFSGKTITIKGQVTKFTPGIMDKNWIHLQDGTDFNGKFDLTITTNQEVKKDDIITVEGKITLDKDFGFGYFYEVIMEDAKLKK